MNIQSIGLILEGGGMRGVYTSGVLQAFMERDLYFPYVIGVSMGACNAANYISRQTGRNKIVNIEFVNDSRYLSYRRLFTQGELFGMKFIFTTIPQEIVPFDYTTFYNSQQKNITVVTDCITGETLYYENKEVEEDYLLILQASSSLPIIQKPVKYKGRWLLDGGLSDSIPIKKSIADGNTKNVIILTQPKGFRKKPERLLPLTKLMYPKFHGLHDALLKRHEQYNRTLDNIEEMQKEGSVFVIQPSENLSVGRVERDKSKLYTVYDKGYGDAIEIYPDLVSYLS